MKKYCVTSMIGIVSTCILGAYCAFSDASLVKESEYIPGTEYSNPSTVLKNTKIVATLGPASNDVETISKLIDAGVNVFRLNFSHGSHESHKDLITNIRKAETITGKSVAILADLQGAKIRIGKFENGSIQISAGDTFVIDSNDKLGNNQRVFFPHPEILRSLKVGSFFYVDDANMRFQVVSISKDYSSATLKALCNGKLKNNKGVNIPNIILPVDVITEKDKKDLMFVLQFEPDWVALSFVQSANDIYQLRQLLGPKYQHIKIIAKIETIPSIADKVLSEITKAADAIMVARGDLSAEVGIQNIGVAQDKVMSIVKKCQKPFVVATQMMESTINNIRPLNAEVLDVSYAVQHGADGVMLSAETAMSKNAVETVKMMAAIARSVERERDESNNRQNYMGTHVMHEYTYDLAGSIASFADYSNARYVLVKLNGSPISMQTNKYTGMLGLSLDKKLWYQGVLSRISLMRSDANIFAEFAPGDKVKSMLLMRNVYPIFKEIKGCSQLNSKGFAISNMKAGCLDITFCGIGE